MSFDPSAWLHDYVQKPAFVHRYPYYAFTLAAMKVVADPAVEVMAVSASLGKFYLHVNINFFARQPQFLDGVLLHEVHHVVLGHITEPRFRGLPHPDLMDLAMEMSANEFIREKLPLHPVLWQDYASLGVQRGQSTLERYAILVKSREVGRPIPKGEFVDDHIPHGVDVQIDLANAEQDGIGTSHADVQSLLKLVIEQVHERGKTDPSIDGEISKLAGCEPGVLIERLKPVDAARELERSWKTAVQMFVQYLRVPFHTYSRPNRRYPHLVGQIAGRLFSPGAADKPRLIVAIDTSASMTTDELQLIARQFRPLSAHIKIIVAEIDTAIHRIYRFQGSIDCVYGRGGTDFRPLFESTLIQDQRPQGIIIFTDGDGPFPEFDPGIKTLWVLTKADEIPCPWGEKAWLRSQAEREEWEE